MATHCLPNGRTEFEHKPSMQPGTKCPLSSFFCVHTQQTPKVWVSRIHQLLSPGLVFQSHRLCHVPVNPCQLRFCSPALVLPRPPDLRFVLAASPC